MNSTDPHTENKRLYAMDVAAVGKEEAIKRWQVKCHDRWGWTTCVSPPLFSNQSEYRRDPDAPPLPSMDWHSAPSGAEYRVQGSRGPIWSTYAPVYMEVGEFRPNPEWFELTAPNKETGMSDEIITDSALMRAIADAMDAGDNVTVFEYSADASYWQKFKVHDDWLDVSARIAGGYQFFRKVSTYTVTLESGETVEVPKPMTKSPRPGTEVYVAFRPMIDPIKWQDDNDFDREWLAKGRCYATREARDQAERALTRILTGGAL